tara:strand:- start:576 stop:869 length:294 start_codon:yes stop_codon:yes gene_type:complete
MNILEYVNPLSFFISFAIGIFLVYLTVPEPKIIIKYPTPDNVNINTYKDHSDTCYKYIANEVKCDNTEKEIKIQHEDGKPKKKKPTTFIGYIKSKII